MSTRMAWSTRVSGVMDGSWSMSWRCSTQCVVRGDVAEGEGSADACARAGIRAPDHRGGAVAGGIEARDGRAVLAQHAGMLVGDHAAGRADVAGVHAHRVERRLLD